MGHSGEEDHPFILCNAELSDLREDSKTIHADFLLTASTRGSIRNRIIGTYKIDLSKLELLDSEPDEVLDELSEEDVFTACKNIYLSTPVDSRILC